MRGYECTFHFQKRSQFAGGEGGGCRGDKVGISVPVFSKLFLFSRWKGSMSSLNGFNSET